MLQLVRGPRGRGLAVRRAVREGEVLLDEAPLLLYVDDDVCDDYCSHCLRCLPSATSPADAAAPSSPLPSATPLRCPHCRICSFCSPACLDQSQAATHTPFLCRALSRLPPRSATSASADGGASVPPPINEERPDDTSAGGDADSEAALLNSEDRTAVRFLLAAYDLLVHPCVLPPLAEAVWGEELAQREGGGRGTKGEAGRGGEEAEGGAGGDGGRRGWNDCFALLMALDGGDEGEGGRGWDGDGERSKDATNAASAAAADGASAGSSSAEAVGAAGDAESKEDEERARARRVHEAVLRVTHDWTWPAGPTVLAAAGSSETATRDGTSEGAHAGYTTSAPSWEVTRALLARDTRNSFGVMAPLSPGGERAVRGYAVYGAASLPNHCCYPNACRFDYFDSSPPATALPTTTAGSTATTSSSSIASGGFSSSTHMQLRAMRDLEQGEEVVVSYFPLGWRLGERSARVKEEYGFECGCERCELERRMGGDESEEEDEEGGEEEGEEGEEGEEAEEEGEEGGTGSDGEEEKEEPDEADGGEEEGGGGERSKGKETSGSVAGKGVADRKGKGKAAGEEDADEADGAADGDDSDEDGDGQTADVSDAELAHALFFMKHLCAVEGCGGTMAAKPGRWMGGGGGGRGGGGEGAGQYEVADDMECNMCGALQSRRELLNALCS
ncbi:unnamed protein product [Closterium sp. NIES-53]